MADFLVLIICIVLCLSEDALHIFALILIPSELVNGPLGNVNSYPQHFLEDQEGNEYLKVVNLGHLSQSIFKQVARADFSRECLRKSSHLNFSCYYLI